MIWPFHFSHHITNTCYSGTYYQFSSWYNSSSWYFYLTHLRVFHTSVSWWFLRWILRDSKFPQVSRTLLSILADLNNAVVFMVSTRLLISKSSNPNYCHHCYCIQPSCFFCRWNPYIQEGYLLARSQNSIWVSDICVYNWWMNLLISTQSPKFSEFILLGNLKTRNKVGGIFPTFANEQL